MRRVSRKKPKVGDLVVYQPFGWKEGMIPGIVVREHRVLEAEGSHPPEELTLEASRLPPGDIVYQVEWAKHPGKSSLYSADQLTVITAHKYQT